MGHLKNPTWASLYVGSAGTLLISTDFLVDFEALFMVTNTWNLLFGLFILKKFSWVRLLKERNCGKSFSFEFWVLRRRAKLCVLIYFDMMKVSWFWLMFLLVGTAFMFLAFSRSSNSFPGMAFPDHRVVTAIATNRKLKAKRNISSFEKKRREADNINLEDYHVVDPVPSSKAAIQAGPIAHGTPLIPYIPKPEPPSHP